MSNLVCEKDRFGLVVNGCAGEAEIVVDFSDGHGKETACLCVACMGAMLGLIELNGVGSGWPVGYSTIEGETLDLDHLMKLVGTFSF